MNVANGYPAADVSGGGGGGSGDGLLAAVCEFYIQFDFMVGCVRIDDMQSNHHGGESCV